MEKQGENDMRREQMVETRDMRQPTHAREEVWQERALRIVIEEPHRQVRPSVLQKLVKCYNGSSDRHDHVATYKQAVHAKQVRDTHTQIEGFGLTLESKALIWFQTLGPKSKVSLEQL